MEREILRQSFKFAALHVGLIQTEILAGSSPHCVCLCVCVRACVSVLVLVYRNLLLVLAVQKLFLTDESELSAVVRGSLVVPCVTSLLFPGLFPLAGGTGGAEPSRLRFALLVVSQLC